MKIAVIGAGWAGLSAALGLQRQGHHAVVFEAARIPGGRARSLHSPRLNATIDNGQHILLGAYTETLALMRELDLPIESRLLRLGLNLQAADGSFRLRAPVLPAPWHLLAGMVGMRGLSLPGRFRLVALIHRLKKQRWQLPDSLTVEQWLTQGHQSIHAMRCFWTPLCLAALNTPIDQASAQLLANVLRDSLGARRADSDMLLPRVDLSELWPAQAARQLDIRYGHAIRHLNTCSTHIAVDNDPFDAVVVATSAHSAARLLRQGTPTPAGNEYLARLAAFRYTSIATISLKLEHAWNLPCPMLMLYDYPDKRQFGQWLFDRSRIAARGSALQDASLSIVISNAGALGSHTRDEIVTGALQQIREQTRRFKPMPKVLGHELIVEKRATFAAVPNLKRPGNATPWPRVWAAGDWTDTGYPAVLEGAVRSGKRAAELIAACR
ncbi:hydroxysqualene dehydroxylase HpnE [Paralcaligenes ginsengisoli]